MSHEPSLPHPDQILATSAMALAQDGEEDLARLLIFSTLEMDDVEEYDESRTVMGTLRGPHTLMRPLFEEYEASDDPWGWNKQGPTTKLLLRIFTRTLPSDFRFGRIIPRVELMEADGGWRRSLLTAIDSTSNVSNQAVGTHTDIHLWQGLRFRSKAEIRIAAALDKKGVLFLPNCATRLTIAGGKRGMREPDFLICDGGRWGILEVDGPHHTPASAWEDKARERLFVPYGIRVIDRRRAQECYENPDWVVDEFLKLLRSP